MKIRTGFVSNSSSSSFVVRGTLVTLDQLKYIIPNINEIKKMPYDDAIYQIQQILDNNNCKLAVISNHDFFNTNPKPIENIILGYNLLSLDDGVVTELTDKTLMKNDKNVKEELHKLNIEDPVISTFLQYISNDNF